MYTCSWLDLSGVSVQLHSGEWCIGRIILRTEQNKCCCPHFSIYFPMAAVLYQIFHAIIIIFIQVDINLYYFEKSITKIREHAVCQYCQDVRCKRSLEFNITSLHALNKHICNWVNSPLPLRTFEQSTFQVKVNLLTVGS